VRDGEQPGADQSTIRGFIMKRIILGGILLATIGAVPALAEGTCTAPQAEWQPKEALQKQLEGQGWAIKAIKVDNGCYEVYATDKDGKRQESNFDPKTLMPVKSAGE
jgi:hypothetical protein